MLRQQTSEVRTYRVFLTDDDGLPLTGLTPTASAWKVSDGSALSAPSVSEINGGFYKVTTGALSEDAVIRVDRGTAGAARYVALEVVVGGYVDSIDATTSSRASQSSVTALGTPAQASALATVQADTDDIQTTLAAKLDATVGSRASQASVTALGSPAQAADYTTVRAAKLDNLDATVSSRATAAALTALTSAVGSPAQAAALTALTSTVGTPAQAAALTTAYLDLLANILTRATPDDVNVTVTNDAYGGRTG